MYEGIKTDSPNAKRNNCFVNVTMVIFILQHFQNQIDVSTRLTSISRLTGGVAHEIKNPLNAIALHLEILKAKLAEAPAVGDEVDVIEREIARLDRVVKTFLDFTRPVELQLDPINLIEMAGEVEALVSPEAEKNHVEVQVRSDLEAAIPSSDMRPSCRGS